MLGIQFSTKRLQSFESRGYLSSSKGGGTGQNFSLIPMIVDMSFLLLREYQVALSYMLGFFFS